LRILTFLTEEQIYLRRCAGLLKKPMMPNFLPRMSSRI